LALRAFSSSTAFYLASTVRPILTVGEFSISGKTPGKNSPMNDHLTAVSFQVFLVCPEFSSLLGPAIFPKIQALHQKTQGCEFLI
jgi:hypothetical protein